MDIGFVNPVQTAYCNGMLHRAAQNAMSVSVMKTELM